MINKEYFDRKFEEIAFLSKYAGVQAHPRNAYKSIKSIVEEKFRLKKQILIRAQERLGEVHETNFNGHTLDSLEFSVGPYTYQRFDLFVKTPSFF